MVIAADYYNRWPEAEITKDITSGRIINWLDRLFMRFGISEKLTSDNGRQFVLAEFKDYLKSRGINHLTTTPYWPRANGMVERLNRSFQSAWDASCLSGLNWKSCVEPFLFAYRSTPHSAIGVTPAEAMLRRKINIGIPEIPKQNSFDQQLRTKANTSV